VLGTVNRQKGQDEAIRALGELVTRGFDVHLRIVGNIEQDDFRQELDALIDALGLRDRVQFTGLISNPVPEIQSAKIMLVCSRDEAFGRATVEAMLLARPVVASSSGANTELIQHEHNGLLYTPGDHRALADRVEELLVDESRALQIAERARSYAAEHFSSERFSCEWLRTIETATQSPLGSGAPHKAR